MRNYTLTEAQSNLGQLIEDAQAGETIIISDDNNHVVQLVPIIRQRKARKAGSARGLIQMSDDFDAPLDDFDEYMS
ncbi:MAG: type II toxin-antitoxin system prevent-host-death family antitoxin [Anaerolineae bacterium]|nr:type II toxin-antitoxin system prevent-host-death family antitoxin [Anaerolineae bacterium]